MNTASDENLTSQRQMKDQPFGEVDRHMFSMQSPGLPNETGSDDNQMTDLNQVDEQYY